MRYQKQSMVIGKEAQEHLKDKKVLIVGLGALGSVTAELIARAGIGHLYLVDGDFVEVSNLQRQSLYTEEDCKNNLPKVQAAFRHLKEINSEISIYPIFEELTTNNAKTYIDQVDLVIDGTDNLETRYHINDHCFQAKIPWIYGAATSTIGSVYSFVPDETPCFRCIFGDEVTESLSCDTHGVLSFASHGVSTRQFTEALKYLTGNKELMNKTLSRFDYWHNQQMEIKVNKREKCSCQSGKIKNSETTNIQAGYELKILCGKEVVIAKFINEEKQTIQKNEELLKQLEKKNIKHIPTPYFISTVIKEKKIRILKDGRIYLYCNDINQAKDIMEEWIS